jgi:hypothetical protein
VYREQFADVPGTIAGRDGRLADILTRLAEARLWKSPGSAVEMPIRRLPERQRPWTGTDVGPLDVGLAGAHLPQPGGRMALIRDRRAVSVTDGQRVFVSDGDCVRA